MAKTLDEMAQQQKQEKEVKVAEVVKMGEKIIIPEEMTFGDAIAQLYRMQQREEETIAVSNVFDASPWDGANALNLALTEKFGIFNMEATFDFWAGKQPPAMIAIENGPDTSVRVPWGRFTVPTIKRGEGWLETGFNQDPPKKGRVRFQLQGEIMRKYERTFNEICLLVGKHLRENSIYKGKAFRIRFSNDDGSPIVLPKPKFMSLNRQAAAKIVLPKVVEANVETNLLTPIRHFEKLSSLDIPFKRGVCLGGKYGVGKTLLAMLTAIECENKLLQKPPCPITFILCQHADEFNQAVEMARQYEPAVVFVEDLDRVTSGGRTVEMDDILNTIDGIESKKHRIMVVVTTNHVENIHQAMIRPGRLDSIIEVHPPDADAVERLIRVYAGNLLDEDADLSVVGDLLAGHVPAVVEECVKRSKLSALKLGKDTDRISAAALADAASSMKQQIDLLTREVERDPTDLERAFGLLGETLVDGFQTAMYDMREEAPESYAHAGKKATRRLTTASANTNGD